MAGAIVAGAIGATALPASATTTQVTLGWLERPDLEKACKAQLFDSRAYLTGGGIAGPLTCNLDRWGFTIRRPLQLNLACQLKFHDAAAFGVQPSHYLTKVLCLKNVTT